MSHLTILPTVLRDRELLISALEALQLAPQRGGFVMGFGGEQHPVDVQIHFESGQRLGWRQQRDGSLELVADLQRVAQGNALPELLGEITRTYAAHLALREASISFSGASIEGVC
ncbi:MAG: DUF1257 domain-containing protein [Cyanobacteriota bacterium]|nr:DUF1257 domain-containing protein [Cyanobacteriota bacterium]